MKIKVLILFCVLFLGIGFEGFGQVTFEDIFPKVEIETDTAHVPLYKKLQILRKLEYAGVYDSGRQVGHFYSRTLQADSSWYVYAGHSIVSRMILLSTQKNEIIDMVLQPRTIDYGEGGHAAIWVLNKEGKYKRRKLFQGGDIKRVYRDKNNILKIELQSRGCCDNYFMCDETYSYKNESLFLEKQICYLYGQDGCFNMREFKNIGTIKTNDSTFLFGSRDSIAVNYPLSDMINYRIKSDSSIFYNYKENVVALIKPNEKGDVLYKEIKDKMYWYLVVFPPKAIQRRVWDHMIGSRHKQIPLAGWIKSKTPLKIESK
ncbi:hypothetical protein WAF17_15920 [Bernardetia sp. ABR2-2B]|uniref:hypothetical protein n=1 Tax=Bernardetia sp. ABR2-2B TaxID=3127472 RepID=UPI0030CAF65B